MTLYSLSPNVVVLWLINSPPHLLRYTIMERCWAYESKDRPTFKDLVKDISDHLLKYSDYLPLSEATESHDLTRANCSSCDPLLEG